MVRAATRQRMALVLAALWWGSLTALGFMVVPLLFTHLDSPAAAGAMAAKLFSAQTWVSLGCGMLILLVFNQKDATAQVDTAQAAIKFIVAGMLLALLVEFGVAPRILSARGAGGLAGAGNLKLWHAMGSAMLLSQWLCAGWALWTLSRPRASSK